ncbi:MAG: rhodanese-like domain-containing protein [Flavobacteriales bacterium]
MEKDRVKKNFKITCIVLGLMFMLAGIPFAHSQSDLQANVELLDPLAFLSKKINLKNTLIDLRSESEYHQSHIEGARNIPFQMANFKKSVDKLPTHSPVLVYCEDGTTSKEAAKLLSNAGFKTIIVLEGGMNAWTKKNLKTKSAPSTYEN